MREEKEIIKRAGSAVEPTGKGGELTPLYVKAEKNIIELGFFTPTTKKLKAPREKVIRFSRTRSGQTVEGTVKIMTAGSYGLPGTADLDKYLALLRIIESGRRGGPVTNPASFTTCELLQVLGHQDAGKNYRTVEEWLDRMYATTIKVSGKAFAEGDTAGRYSKERNRVFDRVVSVGRELEAGVVAERNYIWFAPWQIASLNDNQTVPVDFETYRRIRNPVARVLVPLLQIWLYASRKDEIFAKGYDELCELLGIEQYHSPSQIRQKLGPALEELRTHEYLSKWDIERRRGADGFKVVLHHGEKFWRDLSRQELRSGQAQKELTDTEGALIELLKQRGVTAQGALKLVRGRRSDQSLETLADQIEFIDALIASKPAGSITNPPGLYVELIRSNTPVPPTFETSRMRRAREEQQGEQQAGRRSAYELKEAYALYKATEVAEAIGRLAPTDYEERLDEARGEFLRRYKHAAKVYGEAATMAVLTKMVEEKIEQSLPLLTFERFCEQQGKGESSNE